MAEWQERRWRDVGERSNRLQRASLLSLSIIRGQAIAECGKDTESSDLLSLFPCSYSQVRISEAILNSQLYVGNGSR